MISPEDQIYADKNAHIPTSEILQDIADTESEIAKMIPEMEHLAATPFSSKDARWNHMRAQSRQSGIEERKKFIEDLQRLLKIREQQNGYQT